MEKKEPERYPNKTKLAKKVMQCYYILQHQNAIQKHTVGASTKLVCNIVLRYFWTNIITGPLATCSKSWST